MDFDETNRQLVNWGRHVRDGWDDAGLGFAPPPTSEQYVAPINVHDEPDIHPPIDATDAEITNHVVISIGCEPGWFDHFRVIVYWYTKRIFDEAGHDARIKRLSRFMKTGFPSAQQMLTDAQRCYWDRRQVVDELKKYAKNVKVRRTSR